MNRKRRNNRKATPAWVDQNTVQWRFKPLHRQIPLKDWVKRLARVHRHDRTAAVQMFEARFGELEAPPLFKTLWFLSRMNHYQRTGFMFPIFMYQDLPVTQSITGNNQGE